MKGIALAVGMSLVVALAMPIGLILMLVAVVTPATSEQIRQQECLSLPGDSSSAPDPNTQSAWTTLAAVDADSSDEGGTGFVLPKWGSPRQQSLSSPAQEIPHGIKTLYVRAGDKYKVPWELLAGIGMAETRHGRNKATSSAGAQGLMQFMPGTFASYGVDGDGDGKAEILSDADSIFSAANYLTRSGVARGAEGVRKALWAYNHSVAYRNDVLFYAWAYANGKQVVVIGDQEDCGDGLGEGIDAPPLTSDRIAEVFKWAQAQRGKPYVWGGQGPAGYDCSGFVGAAFRHIGIRLPRTAESMRLWAHKNAKRVPVGQEQPGDLAFTNTWRGPNEAGHVMIVFNPGQHTSWESRPRSLPRGVGVYKYSDFARNAMYEFWRVADLADEGKAAA